LQLRDGSLQIPRLGLALKDIQFEAESAAIQGAGSDELNYQLQLRSGDGKIVAKGQTRLDPAAGWPTHISLSGEQFEVSHIPEARIVINPKLEMKMARHEIWIDGEVVVPRAHLQPKEFTRVAAPSNDVVILGAPESASPRWQIHNRVRLILGERVSLYGFGFEGTIGGNLMLIDDPGKATTASGELNVVEGRYRAYGQRLDVEQGRLLFAGGPITNPALDLRAVRHIQEVTAGIKVYGPLRQPQFELFSVPAMDQTDILAYLVLGMPLEQTTSDSDGTAMANAALALGLSGGDLVARSIGDRFGIEEMRIESSEEGGQTSLVIGRYLSPRLYVGYGVGLIDSVNTFNLRYRLSKHLQLKAESGLEQSADVIYTIDR
jgi:translocation and assembly module TamB